MLGMRSEVMVTKVQIRRCWRRTTRTSVKEVRLGPNDVIDLLLIHWPTHVFRSPRRSCHKQMKSEGYTRQIGVSNFTVALLDEASKIYEPLITTGRMSPVLNQTRMQPAASTAWRLWLIAHRVAARRRELLESWQPIENSSTGLSALAIQQGIIVSRGQAGRAT